VPSSRESAAIAAGDNRASHFVISPRSCAAVLQTIASRRKPIQRVVLSARGECANALAVRPYGDLRRVSLLLLRSAVRRFGARGTGFDRWHGKPALRPPLHSLRRGGLAEIQYPCELDSGGDAAESAGGRAPLRQRAQWG
jgi:hypothetical protein